MAEVFPYSGINRDCHSTHRPAQQQCYGPIFYEVRVDI